MERMQRHPAVLIPYVIEVDVLMVPLVQECWRLGWPTRYCCQGHPSSRLAAYISFRGPYAEAFQQAVLREFPDWKHALEANGEVIRFRQAGIDMALSALQKLERCNHGHDGPSSSNPPDR